MAKLYTRKSDGTYVPYNPQSVTNIDIVQETGNSVTAAMSQDAVTKELTKKVNKATTLSEYGITNAYTKSEVDTKLAAKAGTAVATTSAAGLMSAADKTKLNGLSQTSITVDSALSTTSTNPAQNKVITVALNSKAPQYQYSTTDLTPNVSSLDTGKIYVVYE